MALAGLSPLRHGFTPHRALKLWHDVALERVRGDAGDLSERQMVILLTIYLETPPHTVRGLAAKLGVTKPVITRALDTMGAMGLVTRKRDEADKRNVVIQRTVDGALYVEQLAETILSNATDVR
ncbi:MAG: MarR family transcriptional regulator [Pseudomonadota bacterium]